MSRDVGDSHALLAADADGVELVAGKGGGLDAARRLRAILTGCELLVFGAAAWGFDWLFHNPYCGLLFACGCSWNWAGPWGAGGWTSCNVHHRHGPQCPWCSVPFKVLLLSHSLSLSLSLFPPLFCLPVSTDLITGDP